MENKNAQRMLERALIDGDLEAMRSALALGAQANYKAPKRQMNPLGTPLALAASHLRGGMCRLAIEALLAAGADPDESPMDWTPLMLAAINGNEAGVRALVGRADREIRDRNGDAAWSLAAGQGRAICFDLLAPTDPDDLARAARLAREAGFGELAESIGARELSAREALALDGEALKGPSAGKPAL